MNNAPTEELQIIAQQTATLEAALEVVRDMGAGRVLTGMLGECIVALDEKRSALLESYDDAHPEEIAAP